MPSAEVILWSRLKARQLLGVKFCRQYGVGAFSLDFCAPEVKLAIELDGDTHLSLEAKRLDAEREVYIESFGIRIIRFTNGNIFENLQTVLDAIAKEIEGRLPALGSHRRSTVQTSEPPFAAPLRKGGKGQRKSRA